VPVRVLTPVARPRGVIVYYHGGGWVIGGLADFDKLGRLLARRTGCVVILAEGELCATRLLKAGVPVRHRRFAGQVHGFFAMVDVLPGAADAPDYVAAAIEERRASELVTARP
jgi:acetyl esterase/lipase